MFRNIEPITILIFVILVLLLFVLARLKKFIGFKPQKIIYQDNGKVSILFSEKYSLCGKPDYILKEKNYYIPVEVKNTDRLYETHIAQLLAYCLLVEENFGQEPPYGILKLQGRPACSPRGGAGRRSREEKISYDKEAKEEILKIVSEMQKNGNFDRSHQNSNRCKACLVARDCDQKLV